MTNKMEVNSPNINKIRLSQRIQNIVTGKKGMLIQCKNIEYLRVETLDASG